MPFAELARRHGVTVAGIQQIHRQVMLRGGKLYLTRNMKGWHPISFTFRLKVLRHG